MNFCGIFLWILLEFTIPLTRGDNLALLSGTLRTIQRAACDGETLALRCPMGTAVSIQLAQYGRPAPGLRLCLGKDSSHSSSSILEKTSNESCSLTPSMQHALLQTVVEACRQKRHCKFGTTIKETEALCTNQTKFVEVAYKCRPLEFRSKIICENETINMKCKRNARIAIYSATFGRVHSQSVQCPQPPGVEEESCEASFSTETAMQNCHGKRRCSLKASTSTFGNPCSTKSRLYLRVVYTCVPRVILKEHYQGDLEEDESDAMLGEEMDSFETDDLTEPQEVLPTTNPSLHKVADNIYQTPAPRNITWPETRRTGFFGNDREGQVGMQESTGQSTDGPIDIDMLGDISGHGTGLKKQKVDERQFNESDGRGRVIGFISEWITSVSFIKDNQEKFILYLTLSIAAGILVFLTILIGRLWWQKRSIRSDNKLQSIEPIPAFGDDVSDIDNDIDLTAVSSSQIHEISSCPIPTSDGVRYSLRTNTLRRQDSDSNPRSFNREGSHFYYG